MSSPRPRRGYASIRRACPTRQRARLDRLTPCARLDRWPAFVVGRGIDDCLHAHRCAREHRRARTRMRLRHEGVALIRPSTSRVRPRSCERRRSLGRLVRSRVRATTQPLQLSQRPWKPKQPSTPPRPRARRRQVTLALFPTPSPVVIACCGPSASPSRNRPIRRWAPRPTMRPARHVARNLSHDHPRSRCPSRPIHLARPLLAPHAAAHHAAASSSDRRRGHAPRRAE